MTASPSSTPQTDSGVRRGGAPGVLIVGMPKTGTSALYASIKQVGGFLPIYEIASAAQVAYLAARADVPRLAKVLVPRLGELGPDLSTFDRKVVIVRDPRDVVISWLLYRPFLQGNHTNAAFIDELVDQLRRKEADPASVSLADLHAVYERHRLPVTRRADYADWFRQQRDFLDAHPDALLLRYEDYLAGQVDALVDHLGFDISNRAELGEYNGFNTRAKAAGGWRHWFTDTDVADHRALFDPYLELHGYDRDWTLAPEPVVEPRVSSEHVRKHVQRLLDNPPSTGNLLSAERYTPERIEWLQAAADDGRETSMLELALAHRDGLGVPQDRGRMAELLQDLTARGNPFGLVQLGFAYRYGVGVPLDAELASKHFAAAAAQRGNARTKALMQKLTPEWEDVAGVARTSARRPARSDDHAAAATVPAPPPVDPEKVVRRILKRQPPKPQQEARRLAGNALTSAKRYVVFIGYPRSGHTLVGQLLNAHRDALISHELDAGSLVMNHAYGRERLFAAIAQQDADFGAIGRMWTGYDYTVPGSAQGQTQHPLVIGDKKGSATTALLNRHPEALARLAEVVALPVTVIHVSRHPLDNIATMITRAEDETHDRIVERYLKLAAAVQASKERYAERLTWVDVATEDVIADAAGELSRLAGALDLDPEPGWLAACSAVVAPRPSRTRDKIEWRPRTVERVAQAVAELPLLQHYDISV